MIFAGLIVKTTICIARAGEEVYFVAESWDEIRDMLGACRDTLFKGTTFSRCRELTFEEIRNIGLEWLEVGVDWIRGAEGREMETFCFFLNNTLKKAASQ